MKKQWTQVAGLISLSLSLSACNYQKVPAPPPGYQNQKPSLNSNAPGMLHPTLVLQKTTPTNKLNSAS